MAKSKQVALGKPQKLTIRLQVIVGVEADTFRIYFKDLITSSVLPALGAELVAGSLEVKKARN